MELNAGGEPSLLRKLDYVRKYKGCKSHGSKVTYFGGGHSI